LSRDLYLKASALIYQRVRYVDEDGHNFVETVNRARTVGNALRKHLNTLTTNQIESIGRGFADASSYLDGEKDAKYVSRVANAVGASMGHIPSTYQLAVFYTMREKETTQDELSDMREALELFNVVSQADKHAEQNAHLWYYQAVCAEILDGHDQLDTHPIAFNGKDEQVTEWGSIYKLWCRKMKPIHSNQRQMTSRQEQVYEKIKKKIKEEAEFKKQAKIKKQAQKK
jgi:hypothetical protein